MAEELKTLVDYVQAIGFVGLLIILAIPKLRKLAGFTNGEHKEGEATLRNDFQKLLTAQQELAGHFNHDTTSLLTEIRDGIAKINQKHDNYELIGIKTRDCEKIK